MAAAKKNDLEGVRTAIAAVTSTYNDPEKTKSACSMLDLPRSDADREERGILLYMDALKWAAEFGNVEMCKLLIQHGAEVDSCLYANPSRNGRLTSPGGVTALGVAALAGQTNAAKCLVEAGANPDYRDTTGSSAADLAGIRGEMEVQQYLWSVMKSRQEKP